MKLNSAAQKVVHMTCFRVARRLFIQGGTASTKLPRMAFFF